MGFGAVVSGVGFSVKSKGLGFRGRSKFTCGRPWMHGARKRNRSSMRRYRPRKTRYVPRIKETIVLILKAWDNLKPQPAVLARIEEHGEQPMEVDDLEQQMMAELDAQLLATTLDEAYDDRYVPFHI